MHIRNAKAFVCKQATREVHKPITQNTNPTKQAKFENYANAKSTCIRKIKNIATVHEKKRIFPETFRHRPTCKFGTFSRKNRNYHTRRNLRYRKMIFSNVELIDRYNRYRYFG